MDQITQNQGQAPSGIDPSIPSGGLLERVRDATTLESGLAIMRNGYGDQLAVTLGSSLDAHAKGGGEPEPDQNSGGTPAKVEIGTETVGALNELFVSLTTDNEIWAQALLANTPQAPAAEEVEQQTTSQSAYA